MNEPKKQHIIPKAFIERFVNDSGKVSSVNKQDRNKKIFQVYPKNICAEKDFYSLTYNNREKRYGVEEYLARLEDCYKPFFESIPPKLMHPFMIGAQIFGDVEKRMIIEYMIMLSIRGLSARKIGEAIIKKDYYPMLKEIKTEHQNERGIDWQINYLKTHKEKMQEYILAVSAASLNCDSAMAIKEMAMRSNCFLCFNNSDYDFISGDDPVITRGIYNEETISGLEMMLPIDSKHMVAFIPKIMCDNCIFNGIAVVFLDKTDNNFVLEINKNIFKQSVRNVFAEKRETLEKIIK